MSINAEEQQLVDAVRTVCAEQIAPYAQQVDEQQEVPRAQLAALSELGVMGINLPEEYGGFGLSSEAMVDMVAAVAQACGSTASIITAHYLATDSVLLGGTPEQCSAILSAAAEGETLGAFGLTEPGAGSNPAEMSTKAVRTDDGWHLTGTKCFITNAGFADFIVIYAITNPDDPRHGISAFFVEPSKVEGIEFGAPEKTMGLRGSPVYEFSFDVQLPADALLGQEGEGFKTAMRVLDRGRIEVAAMSVGVASAALDAAIDYAKTREINGKPIGRLQGIAFKLADMHARLAAATLLTADAAQARDTGVDFTIKSATAKLVASEAASFVTDEALQIHGGYGFTRDFPLERYARDCRIYRIYEGSSEIQRSIISRQLLR